MMIVISVPRCQRRAAAYPYALFGAPISRRRSPFAPSPLSPIFGDNTATQIKETFMRIPVLAVGVLAAVAAGAQCPVSGDAAACTTPDAKATAAKTTTKPASTKARSSQKSGQPPAGRGSATSPPPTAMSSIRPAGASFRKTQSPRSRQTLFWSSQPERDSCVAAKTAAGRAAGGLFKV